MGVPIYTWRGCYLAIATSMQETVVGPLSAIVLVEKFGPGTGPYALTILEIYKMHTAWSTPSLKVAVTDSGGVAVVTVGEGAHIDTHALRRLGDTTPKFDTMCRRVLADFEKNVTIYELHNVSNEPRRYEVEEANVVQSEMSPDPGVVVRDGAEFSDAPDCVGRKRIQRIISLYSASSKRIPQFCVLSEVASADIAKLYLTNIRSCNAGLLHRLVRDPLVGATRVLVTRNAVEDGAMAGHGEMTMWLPLTTGEGAAGPQRRRGLTQRLSRAFGC